MNEATQIQELDEVVCILHNTNTLKKNMNPTIFLPAMGLTVGQNMYTQY